MPPVAPNPPAQRWKRAVEPAAHAPDAPSPESPRAPAARATLLQVLHALALFLGLAYALLAVDAGFRAMRAAPRPAPVVDQAFAKALVDRQTERLKKAGQPAASLEDTYAEVRDELERLHRMSRSRDAMRHGFDEVLHEKDSSFAKLHALVVSAMLLAVAVAGGVFLVRLLENRGIIEPDLLQRIKDLVNKGGSPPVPPAASPTPPARGIIQNPGPLAIPLSIVGGALAATLVLDVQVAKPDALELAFRQPPAIQLKLEPTTQQITASFAVSTPPLVTTVTFVPQGSPPPAPTTRVVYQTTTFNLDTADLKNSATELAKVATRLTDIAEKFRVPPDRGPEIAAANDKIDTLAQTTWHLMATAAVNAADLQAIANRSVTTAYGEPPRCSPLHLAKLRSDEIRAMANATAGDRKPGEISPAQVMEKLCAERRTQAKAAGGAQASTTP